MRQVGLEKTDLESCVGIAKQERLLLTRKGKPVALLVSVEGLDAEQLQLGSSEKFWKLITKRRKQKTISRSELERRIDTAK